MFIFLFAAAVFTIVFFAIMIKGDEWLSKPVRFPVLKQKPQVHHRDPIWDVQVEGEGDNKVAVLRPLKKVRFALTDKDGCVRIPLA